MTQRVATPTPPRRPLFRLLTCLRSVLAVVRDPEDTASGVRMVRAIDGRRLDDNLRRFAADPMGARILDGAPSLYDLLTDRDALRRRPEGSLGRSYLAFVEEERISTEQLREAIAPVEREFLGDDPVQERFSEHMSAMHDLWHVLTGYSRDILGELLLLAFSDAQLDSRAFRWIVRVASLGIDRRIPGARALLAQARERGARAPWLATENWEAFLDLPLAEVRSMLELGPPPRYTRYRRNPRGFGLVPEPTRA